MSADAAQHDLFLRTVQLIEPGQKVTPPRGIVYSTDPKTALGTDNNPYFLKGPATEVVVAEAAAHLLARVVELPVPDFGLASIDGQNYFASKGIKFRNVELHLQLGKIANPQALTDTIVFDIWIANCDRNMGNFVGEVAENPDSVRIYPIDFEKAATLRERTPLVSVPQIEPRRFWPRNSLGTLLAGRSIPRPFCDRVSAVTTSQVARCIETLAAHIGPINWAESSIQVLVSRAANIHMLCSEVWR